MAKKLKTDGGRVSASLNARASDSERGQGGDCRNLISTPATII